MAVITLAGDNYEIPDRFNIGELKQMAEVVDAGGNVVGRSRALIEVALARKHPEVKLSDDFETTMAEINAAASSIIDIAGFVQAGKAKAAAAA